MPNTLRDFTEMQRDAIEAAVADAESRTHAEIVVAVAPRSGRYDRAEDIFGVILALIAVTVAWLTFQRLVPSTRDWSSGIEPTMNLVAVLALFAFWFAAGAALATRFPALARPLILRSEMEEEVRRSGTVTFVNLRVGSTADRAAILIYVSLFEHLVWVCPDDAVAAKIPDDAWKPLAEEIAIGFRNGRGPEALAEGVRKAGEILAEHFPPSPEDTSELPNEVRSA
jgi:putative membrane protein